MSRRAVEEEGQPNVLTLIRVLDKAFPDEIEPLEPKTKIPQHIKRNIEQMIWISAICRIYVILTGFLRCCAISWFKTAFQLDGRGSSMIDTLSIW